MAQTGNGLILAIDGGGSRTRAAVIDAAGRVRGRGESGPSNHLLHARQLAQTSLAEAIEQAVAGAGVDWPCIAATSAGLAGVDYDGLGADEGTAMLEACGAHSPLVNGDMVIAHAGALAGGPGVLALAGTGSSVLGIDAGGQRVKIGGWGPIYGDQGSAYRIAQAGLAAAAQAIDETGEPTALTHALAAALGVDEFRHVTARIYAQGRTFRDVAALSRVVSDAAVAGDAVSRRILERAGQDLAYDVAAAASRLGLAAGVMVSYAGAVLTRNAVVRAAFEAAVAARLPLARVVAPRCPPIAGAFLLGLRAVGWDERPDRLEAPEAIEW